MSSVIVSGDTSGSISITAPLVAGSGVLTLPTGTDTLVGKATTDTLTNKSIAATQLTGTIAASVLPAGSVLQVVQGSYSTTTTNSTTTYADTGLTATITPQFSTSKILVMVSQSALEKPLGNTQNCIQIALFRGATQLTSIGPYGAYTNSLFFLIIPTASLYYLDSPAVTSALTYKTQFRNGLAASIIYVQSAPGVDPATSTITLMEIAG